MEVTVHIDDESIPQTLATFGAFTETMTVYDIKKRIQERFGFPPDK
jgi:hypothetical protein